MIRKFSDQDLFKNVSLDVGLVSGIVVATVLGKTVGNKIVELTRSEESQEEAEEAYLVRYRDDKDLSQESATDLALYTWAIIGGFTGVMGLSGIVLPALSDEGTLDSREKTANSFLLAGLALGGLAYGWSVQHKYELMKLRENAVVGSELIK